MSNIVSFYFFDLYRDMWRYTSIAALFNIIKAAGLSALIIISFILFRTRPDTVYVSAFILSISVRISPV